MGFLVTLMTLIVVGNVLAGVGIFALARQAIKAGRRALGQAREQRKLAGESQAPAREAQDVKVEPVGEHAHASSNKRPKAPEGATKKTSQQVATKRTSSQTYSRPYDYVRLDIDEGATVESISEVMADYAGDAVLGERAIAVVDTLESAERRRISLFAELDGTFQRGTISWDKFAGPAYAAHDAILRNSALLANRIQAFDSAGYLRLRESMVSEGNDSHHSETRQRRWKLFHEMLDSLDTLQETNEGLLLELDKLATELSTIPDPDQAEDSDQIIEEIRRLVDEAKYYRQIGQ